MKKILLFLITLGIGVGMLASPKLTQRKNNLLKTVIQTNTLNLDSIIVKQAYETVLGKISYKYDAKGNQTQQVIEMWDDENNKWYFDDKTTYEYTASGKKSAEYEYDWEEDMNQWGNYYRTQYKYNTADSLISVNEYDWVNNKWRECDRKEYEYSLIHGKKVMDRSIYSDGKFGYIVKYDYNEKGLLSNKIISNSYSVDLNKLEETEKTNYTYNEQGQLMTKTSYYKGQDDKWNESLKNTYEYNSNGNKTLQMNYRKVDTEWKNESKEVTTYANDDKDVTSIYSQIYNNEWEERSMHKSSYNDAGNQTLEELYYKGPMTGNKWIGDHKRVVKYENNTVLEYIEDYEWSFGVGEWEMKKTFKYYYSTSKTGIDNHAKVISIYPNITEGVIYLQGTDCPMPITVYTVQGKYMMQTIGTKIDLSDFPAGWYIINVDGKSLKVIKK